ncbi:MAG TPA: universal stress protein, partial [Thermoanaerobaculia bacterium]|nr:universal stress protein [Thermoanaerobaculia bacterium]
EEDLEKHSPEDAAPILRARLAETIGRAGMNGAGIRVESFVRRGAPWEKLSNVAVEVGADLIVVGATGEGLDPNTGTVHAGSRDCLGEAGTKYRRGVLGRARLEILLVRVDQRDLRTGGAGQPERLREGALRPFAEISANDDPSSLLHDLNLGHARLGFRGSFERSPSNMRQTSARSIIRFASSRSPVVEPSANAP